MMKILLELLQTAETIIVEQEKEIQNQLLTVNNELLQINELLNNQFKKKYLVE